tara:strand:- start:7447 stop:7593 length:147 start_codon:yes stop_codon:yes gene_type:complete
MDRYEDDMQQVDNIDSDHDDWRDDHWDDEEVWSHTLNTEVNQAWWCYV